MKNSLSTNGWQSMKHLNCIPKMKCQFFIHRLFWCHIWNFWIWIMKIWRNAWNLDFSQICWIIWPIKAIFMILTIWENPSAKIIPGLKKKSSSKWDISLTNPICKMMKKGVKICIYGTTKISWSIFQPWNISKKTFLRVNWKTFWWIMVSVWPYSTVISTPLRMEFHLASQKEHNDSVSSSTRKQIK